jgi:hypothetical protein
MGDFIGIFAMNAVQGQSRELLRSGLIERQAIHQTTL